MPNEGASLYLERSRPGNHVARDAVGGGDGDEVLSRRPALQREGIGVGGGGAVGYPDRLTLEPEDPCVANGDFVLQIEVELRIGRARMRMVDLEVEAEVGSFPVGRVHSRNEPEVPHDERLLLRSQLALADGLRQDGPGQEKLAAPQVRHLDLNPDGADSIVDPRAEVRPVVSGRQVASHLVEAVLAPADNLEDGRIRHRLDGREPVDLGRIVSLLELAENLNPRAARALPRPPLLRGDPQGDEGARPSRALEEIEATADRHDPEELLT